MKECKVPCRKRKIPSDRNQESDKTSDAKKSIPKVCKKRITSICFFGSLVVDHLRKSF